MKLSMSILILLVSLTSFAQPYDVSQGLTIKNLGLLAEQILKERNAHESTYSDINLQLKLNEDNGYIGRDKHPDITPQILINEIDTFLNFAEANTQLASKNKSLLNEILYKLTGSSIALKSIYTISADINTVQMIQRRLYNRNCFNYGSLANVKVKEPISFIWMSECYQYQKSIDQVNWMFNHIRSLETSMQNDFSKFSYIGLELGYEALTNKDIKGSLFDSSVSSKLDIRIDLAMDTIWFAKKVNNQSIEYEILKIVRPLLLRDFSKKKQLEEVEERMKEIAIEKGVLTYIQKKRLELERWWDLILVLFIFTSPILYWGNQSRWIYKYGSYNSFPGFWCSVWLALKGTVNMLTGISESKGRVGFFRTLWLFMAAYYMSSIVSKSSVELSEIIIRN